MPPFSTNQTPSKPPIRRSKGTPAKRSGSSSLSSKASGRDGSDESSKIVPKSLESCFSAVIDPSPEPKVADDGYHGKFVGDPAEERDSDRSEVIDEAPTPESKAVNDEELLDPAIDEMGASVDGRLRSFVDVMERIRTAVLWLFVVSLSLLAYSLLDLYFGNSFADYDHPT
ncbi:hypothetical protein QJS10_CPA16g01677 [Acorus calamus]|uniref:Uncharacterized protein n=1 Tax=Acorus calamus TaxID=4465 RepID=A0AAV9D595_ACOCL|nr:hypothetical protein QJS10_CPA16g01677 [Acorus calamus]